MSHYDTLGLSEDANTASIRATYLRLVQIYHPDHNSDPAAHRKTAEIIEAYSVLGDLQRRAEYDASRRKPPPPSQEAQAEDVRQVIKAIACQACGCQDATLRIATFYWVTSLLVITRRGTRDGTWCERCRAKQAALWSLVSGVFGWWGFPWGPIYTVPALYHNAVGGKKSPKDNAALLRLVGFQLFEKGRVADAVSALDFSLDFEEDEDSKNFADSLRVMRGSFAPRKLPLFRVLTAAPSVIVLIVLGIAIAQYFRQPSGYAARFEATKQPRLLEVSHNDKHFRVPVEDATASKMTSSAARDEVNALVDKLAESVKAQATPAGSHQEGTTTIYDYELDRTKYADEPFDKIASEISPFTAQGDANSDGFASSGYFNSRLMALSITILNRFDAGEDISAEVKEVGYLESDARVQPWLANSKYNSDFQTLNGQLKYMLRQQHLGVSRSKLESDLKSLDGKTHNAKTLIESARAASNREDEHQWVEKYNNLVDAYNSDLRREKRSRVAYEKVDLAFNRCFDPAILMSRFQQVNLTASAQTVDALPTD